MSEQSSVGPSNDEKNMALLAHLGGIVFGFVPALIIWLVKKEQGEDFAVRQAKEALNFQITALIGYVISWVLMFLLIGFLVFMLLWVAVIVFSIIGAVAASKGTEYKYPFALRLIN